MVQVINRGPSFGGNLGTAFGTGLGSGLQALAEHKMNEIKRQKIESFLRGQQGFNPESANATSYVPEKLQVQALKNKQITPQQEEKHRTIANEYDTLQEIIDTSDRIIKATDNPELSLGLIARGKAAIDPTQLNEPTANFFKDTSHLFNLKTEALKGLVSKHRLQRLGEDKPGLNLSRNVNRKLAEQYREAAMKAQRNIQKSYPGVLKNKQVQAQQSIDQVSSPQASPQVDLTQYVGDNVQDDNGNFYKWVVSENRYLPAKKKD